MNRLKKMLSGSLSKEEEHEVLESVFKNKFDQDLRTKWRDRLKKEYGVVRSPELKNNNGTSIFSLKTLIAMAASLGLIILVVRFFIPSSPALQQIAQAYLDEQEVSHPGLMKGATNEHEKRILAVQAFNLGDFGEASQYFEMMDTQTEEDLYYHALALLMDKEYPQALNRFSQCRNMGAKFYQELNWYQGLAYLLNDQKSESKRLLMQIDPSEWNHDKAQVLLARIE